MEFPSPHLMQQLTAIGLSLPADLKRVIAVVRRISRGLPPSDSIWIDALVTTRRLPPWQGQRLEAGAGPQLILGDQYVLQKPRILDSRITAYQAQSRGRKQIHFVTGLRSTTDAAEETQTRLNQIISNLAKWKDSVPGLPTQTLYSDETHWLISPYRTGETLANMLVRRGRFPEDVVRSIAAELIRQLQLTEPAGPHGDLRLKNLWMSSTGELQLLNWQFFRTLEPVVTIHSHLPSDAADGIAPERLIRQSPASTVADIYSLGCLLWQLLAGRPPFLVADPLAKLTSHCRRNVPDLLIACPTASREISEILKTLTNQDPAERPQSWNEVQKLFQGQRRRTARVQKFARSFEETASRQKPVQRRPARFARTLAATILMTAVLGGLAWNRDVLGLPGLSRIAAHENRDHAGENQTNSLPSSSTAGQNSSSNLAIHPESQLGSTKTAEASRFSGAANELSPATERQLRPASLLPLPEVVLGELILQSGQHYQSGSLSVATPLQIRVTGTENATIHISDTPLRLRATQTSVAGVTFYSATRTAQSSIEIETDDLVLDHCLFESAQFEDQQASGGTFIRWNAATTTGSLRLLVKNSEFLYRGTLFELHRPLATALFQNMASDSSKTLLSLKAGSLTGIRTPVVLKNCTLQETGPLLKLGELNPESGLISVQGSGTLIDLELGEGLIELSGKVPDDVWARTLEISAEDLFVPAEMILVLSRNPATGEMEELTSPEFVADGLLSAVFHHSPAQQAENQVVSSRNLLQIQSFSTRSGMESPGADPTLLPTRQNAQ